MDLDAFVTEHAAEWHRLEQLSRRRARRLTPAEVDELVVLYQRTATHLSAVKSQTPDPTLVARLSRLVLLARGAITGGARLDAGRVARLFTQDFPAAVYRARFWCFGTAIAFIAVTAGLARYFQTHPDAVALLMSPAEVDRYVNSDFENYYSNYAASHFAVGVWTNNAWITALCLAGGILIVPTLYVLWNNAFSTGLICGVMFANGRGDVFLQLIAPHGLLELTCVFIGSGVGLRMAWSWIAPGPDRTRSQALTTASRDGVITAIGLAVVLGVSGIVEAFVTPAGIAIEARIAIGATVWASFLAYVWIFGRRHARAADLELARRLQP